MQTIARQDMTVYATSGIVHTKGNVRVAGIGQYNNGIAVAPSSPQIPKFQIGDDVEVKALNPGRVISRYGRIAGNYQCNYTILYQVIYNDGSKELGVEENRITQVIAIIHAPPANNPSGGIYTTYSIVNTTPVPKFKSGSQETVQFSGKTGNGTVRCSYTHNNSYNYDIDLVGGATIFGIPEPDVSMLTMIFEQPFDYEITNDLVAQPCTCKTLDLMAYGCKCGAFQREKNE